MQRVTVSVRREDERFGRDLEIPAELGARELATLVSTALGWPTGPDAPLHIHLDPPGRTLTDDETLDAAGVTDGARLVLTSAPHVVSAPAAPAPRPRTPVAPVLPRHERTLPTWLAPVAAGLVIAALVAAVTVWAIRPQGTPEAPVRSATATPVAAETPTPLVLTLQPR